MPADGPRALELAELHRAFLSRRFYECTYARHRELAELYVPDPRFTQTFDSIAHGLAHYVHDAILANADAHR